MRLIYFIAAIMIYMCNITAQVNLDSGLVAYYPFNGNANDESENGNHGVVNGATLTNDRFGNANSAYYFDGVNDLITIPHSATINFNTSSESYTFSVWANSNDPGQSRLIDKWNEITGTPYPISIQVSSGGCSGNIYNGNNAYGVSFGNIWDGQWKHLVFLVNSSSNQINSYVNGSLVDSITYPTSISTANSIDLYLAFRPIQNDFYQGFIDDMRIYNRVLNNEEIDSLFNEVLTSIESKSPILLDKYELEQNFPNPFNPTTNIIFEIPTSGIVKVRIYDILGHLMEIDNYGYKNAGKHKVNFNGSNYTSGVYFYQIQYEDEIKTKKMLLLK